MNEFLEKIKRAYRSSIEFLGDTRKELKNVSWPSRREVTGTTLVVIATVFFFGFFLFVVDILVKFGTDKIYGHVSR